MGDNISYPPLTPLSEYPMHGWDYNNPYACQPGGLPGIYDWRCRLCVDIAQAEVVAGRDKMLLWKQSANHEDRPVQLSWLVNRARSNWED